MRIERKTAGNVTILTCAGTIDADGVRALGEKADAVVQTGCRRLVFSLGDVKFFDSTVLDRLTTAARRLKEVQGKAVISGSFGTLRMLRSLGLAKRVRIFPHDRAALAYFGEEGGDVTGSGSRLEPPRPSDSAGSWPEEHPRPRP